MPLSPKRRAQIKGWQGKNKKSELARLRRQYKRNRIEINVRNQRLAAQVKVETLAHYGPSGKLQCSWPECLVIDPDMLSLDHIDNSGANHRRVQGGGVLLYRVLKRSGFPAGYQTLCHNHQWKKELMRRRENRIGEKNDRAST